MEQKKLLDNLSGQEIREMIDKKEISIEELDRYALDAVFDYESERVCAGESDDELLRRCAELLDFANPTAEGKYRELIHTALAQKTIAPTPTRKKATRLRKVLIVAATLVVLVFGASAVAGAFGTDLRSLFKQIMGMSKNSQLEAESITLIRYDDTKEYASVEELLHDQALTILYPTKLPEDVSIKTIYVDDMENGRLSIRFYTGDTTTSIVVETNAGSQTEDYSDCEHYRFEERDYYLFEESDFYYAICYYNNNFYSLRSTNRENIILIIENMKEIES